MSTKIIVSYDGTANEDDAIALGRVFARAGAEVSVAYVRHSVEPDYSGETLAQNEAEGLLERAAGLLGNPDAAKHVVTDRSTPEGLRALAEAQGADAIVFCSDSHTAKGHVAIGNSAERLLEGGSTAVAIAPAGLAQENAEAAVKRVVAIGDANGGARGDRPGPGSGARRDRRSCRQPGRRPAGHRLAYRRAGGPGFDQLLGIASDRDRHLLGAGGAAVKDTVLRQVDRRSRRLASLRAGVHGPDTVPGHGRLSAPGALAPAEADSARAPR